MLFGGFCLSAEGSNVFIWIGSYVGMMSHGMAFAAVESGLLICEAASLHSVAEDLEGYPFPCEANMIVCVCPIRR